MIERIGLLSMSDSTNHRINMPDKRANCKQHTSQIDSHPELRPCSLSGPGVLIPCNWIKYVRLSRDDNRDSVIAFQVFWSLAVASTHHILKSKDTPSTHTDFTLCDVTFVTASLSIIVH